MPILRQSCAGLVWSKADVPYDVARWLDGDPGAPSSRERTATDATATGGTSTRSTLLAMPDRGVPLFAAWDLGFHAVSWPHFDLRSRVTKLLVCCASGSNTNGSIPVRWNFDDVNRRCT